MLILEGNTIIKKQKPKYGEKNGIIKSEEIPYATIAYPDEGIILNTTDNPITSDELNNLITILEEIKTKIN